MNNIFCKKIKLGSDIYYKNFSSTSANLETKAIFGETVGLEQHILDYNLNHYFNRELMLVIEMHEMPDDLINTILLYIEKTIISKVFGNIHIELNVDNTCSINLVSKFVEKLCVMDCVRICMYIFDTHTESSMNDLADYYQSIYNNFSFKKVNKYIELDDLMDLPINDQIDISTLNLNSQYPKEVENELINEYVYKNLCDEQIRQIVFKLKRYCLMCKSSYPFYYIISSKGNVRKCKHYENEDTIIGLMKDNDMLVDYEKLSKWCFQKQSSKCMKCYMFPTCMGMACPRVNIINNDSICPKEKYLLDAIIID